MARTSNEARQSLLYMVSERSERAFWKTSTLAMGVTGDLLISPFFCLVSLGVHLGCFEPSLSLYEKMRLAKLATVSNF